MSGALIELGQYTDTLPNTQFARKLSIDSVLSTYMPFPKLSVVIGICTDDFPFIIDLGNPRSGSILVAGDDRYELTQILRTMVISACRINSSDDINIVLITKNSANYADLNSYPHFQALSPYERSTGEMVIEIASVSEQRRSGRERGAAVMLMIDGFQDFSKMLSDYSVFLNLRSLVASGPKSLIWPIITVSANAARNVNDQLGGFDTCIAQYPKETNTYAVRTSGSCFNIYNLST